MVLTFQPQYSLCQNRGIDISKIENAGWMHVVDEVELAVAVSSRSFMSGSFTSEKKKKNLKEKN